MNLMPFASFNQRHLHAEQASRMSAEVPTLRKGLMRLMGRRESGKTGGEIRSRQQQVAAETLGKFWENNMFPFQWRKRFKVRRRDGRSKK